MELHNEKNFKTELQNKNSKIEGLSSSEKNLFNEELSPNKNISR